MDTIYMTREQITARMTELVPEKYKKYSATTFKNIPNKKLTENEIAAKREIYRLYYALNIDNIREKNKQYYKPVKKNKITIIQTNLQ